MLSVSSGAGTLSISSGILSYNGVAIAETTFTSSTSLLDIVFTTTVTPTTTVAAILQNIDFENTEPGNRLDGTRTVTINLYDDLNGVGTATLQASVEVPNVAPVYTGNSSLSILESTGTSRIGTTVATLTASDDMGVAITWSMVGGTGQDILSLDSATGVLSLKTDTWLIGFPLYSLFPNIELHSHYQKCELNPATDMQPMTSFLLPRIKRILTDHTDQKG